MLSTSFFGPRFRVVYEGAAHNSDAPPGSVSEISRSSLRPREDMPLALRLVEADAPSLLERLAQAVSDVRDVDHRAVLRPLQIVRASTRLGIVTPYVQGLTLSQLLQDASERGESIAPAVAIGIVSDVVSGLQALAEHGRSGQRRQWTYGGLTPDSIFVGRDGQTRLLDPGVAAAAARRPCWSHEASALAYTAPEQTGADANHDEASDTFALGVMLWELLSCRALFRASTAAETLERVHRMPIPRVQRQQFVRGEPIAFALAQMVNQALRRDVKQRFAYYTDFLRAMQAGGETGSRAAIAEQVQLALASSPPHTIEEAAEPASGTRRSRSSLPAAPPTAHAQQVQSTSGASTEAGPPPEPAAEPASFEPPTERLAELAPANDSYWPAHAKWSPEPDPADKISAHPLSDLIRIPSADQGRNQWSTALAGAAVLALFGSIWALLTPSVPATSTRPNAATQPHEVQQPPLPVMPAARPLTAAAPVTGSRPPALSKPGPERATPPTAAPANPRPGVSTPRTTASAEPAHRPKLDKPRKQATRPKSPAEAEAKPDRTTFIPDDI